MTLLLILLTSCGTSKKVNTLPSLNFPDFPIDPDLVEYTVKHKEIREYSEITLKWINDESKTVTLPFWFYEDLIKYEIDSYKIFEQYEYLRVNYVPKISEL